MPNSRILCLVPLYLACSIDEFSNQWIKREIHLSQKHQKVFDFLDLCDHYKNIITLRNIVMEINAFSNWFENVLIVTTSMIN